MYKTVKNEEGWYEIYPENLLEEVILDISVLESPTGVKHSKSKLPMHTVLFKQFPKSIKEVVKCSMTGHEKYKETDEDWKNFERVENAEWEYMNAAVRHMGEKGINKDMLEYGEILHEAQVIWNLLAALEIKLK